MCLRSGVLCYAQRALTCQLSSLTLPCVRPTGEANDWRLVMQHLLWAGHNTLSIAYAGMSIAADLQALR